MVDLEMNSSQEKPGDNQLDDARVCALASDNKPLIDPSHLEVVENSL
jgi:hypothetical protein